MNETTQTGPVTTKNPDPCGLNLQTNVYDPIVGYAQTEYIRFSHPDAALPKSGNDAYTSISIYSTPAYTGALRVKVWDSLDESADIISFTSVGATGAGIIDASNPGCSVGTSGSFAGDFSGYVTIDVVNYCTNFFPDQKDFYEKDAIATLGWDEFGFTPNVLMGDVYYIDPAASGGNISGDTMVALEFDSRLNWDTAAPGPKTFYGRHVANQALPCEKTVLGGTTCNTVVDANYPTYRFGGDGREPLGDRYGFRYLTDSDNSLQTWLLVWREDLYRTVAVGHPAQTTQNLCDWLARSPSATATRENAGLFDDDHQIIAFTYDNDEQTFAPGGSGGPSGGGGGGGSQLYIFLEASRIKLLGNTEINPGYNQATREWVGGWIDMTLRGPSATVANIYYNQAWVGVQHSGPGVLLSVGHGATLLDPQFNCNPNRVATGNRVDGATPGTSGFGP